VSASTDFPGFCPFLPVLSVTTLFANHLGRFARRPRSRLVLKGQCLGFDAVLTDAPIALKVIALLFASFGHISGRFTTSSRSGFNSVGPVFGAIDAIGPNALRIATTLFARTLNILFRLTVGCHRSGGLQFEDPSLLTSIGIALLPGLLLVPAIRMLSLLPVVSSVQSVQS